MIIRLKMRISNSETGCFRVIENKRIGNVYFKAKKGDFKPSVREISKVL